MNLSLNEVQATAKKAARGAGYSWGLAEDAARNTRWLCAHGFDGCGALAEWLPHAHLVTAIPERQGAVWTTNGLCCPIMLGAALSDFAEDLRSGPIEVRAVRSPMLVLPAFAQIASMVSSPVTATWETGRVTIADGIKFEGTFAQDSVDLTLSLGGTAPLTPTTTRATPDPSVWATLTQFAHRTYAPATEASRLLGAGAGLSDND